MRRLLLVSLMLPGLGLAQQPTEPIEPTIHWAYASHFGTGWYKLTDERSTFIMRVSPRWQFGDAGLADDGARKIGYTLQVPVAIGLSRLDFTDIPGIIAPDNFATASVGILGDANIPVTERWSIRANAQLGYGTVVGENDWAWTYKGEIRNRYALQTGKLEWALLANLGRVGFDPNIGDPDAFSFVALGAEFGYPGRPASGSKAQRMFYWHVVYTELVDRIELPGSSGERQEIANYWQVGAALGKRGKKIRIWKLSFERLGLGYSFSDTGDFRGVKFVFRSLYDL